MFDVPGKRTVGPVCHRRGIDPRSDEAPRTGARRAVSDRNAGASLLPRAIHVSLPIVHTSR